MEEKREGRWGRWESGRVSVGFDGLTDCINCRWKYLELRDMGEDSNGFRLLL